jgi:hypothetical protein
MADEQIQDEQPQETVLSNGILEEKVIEVYEPVPDPEIPGPPVAIDSIHAASTAIEGIWARLYQLEQANVIHVEGNDAKA